MRVAGRAAHLDVHVRERLVRDEDARLQHESARERDALPHARAEFVRILRRGAERQHELVEERRHAHREGSLIHSPVAARDGFADDLGDRERGPAGVRRPTAAGIRSRYVSVRCARPGSAHRDALDVRAARRRRASPGSSAPASTAARLDLPDPVGPITASVAACGSTNETPSMTRAVGAAARGACDGQIGAADGDIGVSTAGACAHPALRASASAPRDGARDR